MKQENTTAINREILRFSNWWIGSSFKADWNLRKEEYFENINRLNNEKENIVKVVVVDQEYTAQVVYLKDLSVLNSNFKVVGVFEDDIQKREKLLRGNYYETGL